MDLDDLLGQLFGEAVAGRLSRSRRTQLVFRMVFGLVGAGLGLVGCLWVLGNREMGGTPPMRVGMAALFFFMACFFAANVMLARRWRWPAVGFAVSLVALFVSRIVFGP